MPDSEIVRLDLPANLKYLSVLEGVINALLGQEATLADREAVTFEVILAVHETCSNIIEHAYGAHPERIELTFSFKDDPRRLVVDIHDTGRPFTLPEIQAPNVE